MCDSKKVRLRRCMPVTLIIALCAAPTMSVAAQSKHAETIPTAKTKEGDTTVYGLHLGDKFSVPECQREGGGIPTEWDKGTPQNYPYLMRTPVFCFKWELLDKIPLADIKPNTPVVTDEVKIIFPEDAHPKFLAGFADDFMLGGVIDGNLERVLIYTGGLDHQYYWLAQLKEKYGEPTSLKEVNEENGFGAVFASLVAKWRFTNLQIKFEGTAGTTDTGSIEIMTNKWHPIPETRVGPKM